MKNAFRLSAGTGNDKMKTVQHNRKYFVKGYLQMAIIILAAEFKGGLHVGQTSGD